MRAADARGEEKITTDFATQMASTKFIYKLRNLLSAVGPETVQFHERSAPCCNLPLNLLDAVLEGFHVTQTPNCLHFQGNSPANIACTFHVHARGEVIRKQMRFIIRGAEVYRPQTRTIDRLSLIATYSPESCRSG